MQSVSQSAGASPDLKRRQQVNGDRLPPHSEEMERGVLGCILLAPDDCLNQCAEQLKTGVDVFYDLRHQEIYRAILELFDGLSAIDPLTIHDRLKNKNLAEQCGGMTYLHSLQDSVPSAANLQYYLDVVKEKWQLRRVVQICADISLRAYDCNGDSAALLDGVERDVMALGRTENHATLDGKMAGDRMTLDMARRVDLQGKLSGLDCGIIDLNRMTEGLQYGEQCIIGARPSQGKTSLGLKMFSHAVFNGVPALFVSLEMSVEAVMRRMLSSHMSIPLKTVKQGRYSESDYAKTASFHALCRRSPMYFIDGVDGVGILQLCSRVRRHVLQHGIKLVVVDYLQKIKPSMKHEKRTYEVAEVSERLKALADETKISMVTLAQLSREAVRMDNRGKTNETKPPRLSDLADSGQIERDADVVGLLYKKDNQTKLIIAKQRDGEVGVIDLYFNAPYVRFENMTNDE